MPPNPPYRGLFDSFGRPIRRPRFFGFGRTPASEPEYCETSGVCADAIGFMIELDEAAEMEIDLRKDRTGSGERWHGRK